MIEVIVLLYIVLRAVRSQYVLVWASVSTIETNDFKGSPLEEQMQLDNEIDHSPAFGKKVTRDIRRV